MLEAVSELFLRQEKGGTTHPLVSVIIPCYNCIEFISEAIESALTQTYPRIEVIVVDDGSTDGSSEIIAHYPVRHIQSLHEGVSAARNRGIRQSKGEYIVFLDADDRLLPQAVSAGFDALKANPDCCMAVGGHNIISYSGVKIRSCGKPLNITDFYARLLKSNFIECPSTAFFRRDIVSRAGGFDSSLVVAEDYDLYLRLAWEYPICCHSTIVTDHRLHKANISHNSQLMLTGTLRVIRSQRKYAFTTFRRGFYYLVGSWLWRRKYGRQLTRDLAIMRNNGQTPTFEKWCLLAQTYPLGILVVLAIRVLPLDPVLEKFSGTQ